MNVCRITALAKGVSLIRKMGRREPRPLRCHANLVPNPLIKPARVLVISVPSSLLLVLL